MRESLAVNDDNEQLIVRAGGVQSVLAAMRAHPGSTVVQEQGCAALCNLSGAADNKVLVARAGGIEVVVAAMRAHRDTLAS